MYQFGKLAHKSLVTLHPTSSVNQNYIKVLVLCIKNSLLSDISRFILVAFFIKWDIQTCGVCGKLLYGTATEIVTPSKHNLQVTFCLEVVSGLRQACRFAYTVHTNKGDAIHSTLLFSSESFLEYVDVSAWGHKCRNGLFKASFNRRVYRCEVACSRVHQTSFHLTTDLVRDLLIDVFVHECLCEASQDRLHVFTCQYFVASD